MTIARYSVTFGLRGCYMPDSASGPYTFTTRRDLAEFIRSEVEFYDLPKASIRQVPLRALWAQIKRHGSSCAHFGIYHGQNALEFHGLTEAEAEEMERDAA